jgi:RNase adaptor protein for sRNA GlmZ degradation
MYVSCQTHSGWWNLSPFSGNDKQVYDYVMDKPETQEFIKRLLAFTDYAFEQYVKEGKNHFTVAIGCTGGQHRSVTSPTSSTITTRKSTNAIRNIVMRKNG